MKSFIIVAVIQISESSFPKIEQFIVLFWNYFWLNYSVHTILILH